jgi:hypothetical protein
MIRGLQWELSSRGGVRRGRGTGTNLVVGSKMESQTPILGVFLWDRAHCYSTLQDAVGLFDDRV